MKKLTFIILLTVSTAAPGQQWKQVGRLGLDRPYCRVLQADTTLDVLFALGGFAYVDSIMAGGMAKWNGTAWDSAFPRINNYGDTIHPWDYVNMRYIKKYNGEYYMYGSFSDFSKGILNNARFDGMEWHPLVGCLPAADHLPLEVVGNDFFFRTYNDSTCGVPSNGMLKYTAGGFAADPRYDLISYDANNNVTGVISYQNELHVFGTIKLPGNLHYSEIIKWNGFTWEEIPAPASPGFLYPLAVYNNELYVTGGFNQSTAPDKIIIRWDGTQWKSAGGGPVTTGGFANIHDAVVYNNELIVVGYFTHIGGIQANHIARWDGTDWCAFDNSVFNNHIYTVEVYHDSLFIGGGFNEISGQPVNYIAKWDGPYPGKMICGNTTNINDDIILKHVFSVFPNPANNHVTVKSSAVCIGEEICLFDITGREIRKIKIESVETAISTSGLSAGVYIISIPAFGFSEKVIVQSQ